MSDAQTAAPAAATETTEGRILPRPGRRRDQADRTRPGAGPGQEPGRAGARRHRHVRQEPDAHVRPRDRGDRPQAVRAAQRDHAPPEVPEARRHLARLHYLVMNSETSTSLKLRVLNVRSASCRGSAARGRVRPEPAVQEDLRERVRHAGRRAVRRADRRLRVDAASGGHRDAAADVERRRRRRSRRSSRPPAPSMFGFDSWTELAKPRDLAKIFESLEYTKWRSFRDTEDSRFVTLVMPRMLARLPYGAATKPIDEFNFEEVPYDEAGAAKSDAARRVLLDERRLRDGHAAHRRLRASTASAPRSAAPKAAARSRACRPTCSPPTTATWTRSARPRSPSPTAASSSCPTSASCRSATTRTPTTRCSSARRSAQKPKKYDRPGGDRERGDLGAPAVHHGDQPLRPLPEGDGPRQDRQLHGSGRLRALAEPLDQQLRQRQRERRARR